LSVFARWARKTSVVTGILLSLGVTDQLKVSPGPSFLSMKVYVFSRYTHLLISR
jgi:hypothetical protein